MRYTITITVADEYSVEKQCILEARTTTTRFDEMGSREIAEVVNLLDYPLGMALCKIAGIIVSLENVRVRAG